MMKDAIGHSQYKNSPKLVNFTGFKTIKKIHHLKKIVTNMKKNINILNVRIDSIFLNRKEKKYGRLHYETIIKHAKHFGADVRCSTEVFPVIDVKFPNLPNIRLFTTTSAQCLGSKSHQEVNDINIVVNLIFKACFNEI